MTKEEANQEIAELVKKYESLSSSEIKTFHEAKTKQGFIEPLFRALGWDFDDTNEVAPEERASNGRVDYAFKLQSVSQFYLEAKPLKATLNKPEYTKQAITYAYSKGVTWVVLTDFEELRLFNAQANKPFLTFTYKDYIANFDKLWLLSRESLENGVLNKEAAQYGALPTPVPIETRLFKQFREWREELFNQLHGHNKELSPKQIDEVVQRLFDRLIFIRTCEDRNLEDKLLLAAANQWKSAGYKGELIEELRQIFESYRDIYDSELFDKHLTDGVFIEGSTIEKVLNGLYEIPGSLASYNFNDIDADVLGAVYEQYLGYVATKVKERVEAQLRLGITDEETFKIISKKQRRKEQGIYYTPEFVTDYIVKETVGRFIKEHDYNEIRTIKILDPACGSGSFLIRAYDELLNYHAGERSKSLSELDQKDRLPVLLTNIYGVDLDMQAVEITRLNLLLRTLTAKGKLPYLSNNIREGNSLISGTEEELKGYFGDEWREKKPFNWKKEFKDIVADGGFDIVIGNPPWGGDIDKDLAYFHARYPATTQEHTDSFKLFIETNLRLVCNGGLVAMIVPNTLLRQRRLRDARSLLLQNQILALVDLGEDVFEGVVAPSCIFVVRKGKPADGHCVVTLDLSKLPIETKIDALRHDAKLGSVCEQRMFLENTDLEFVSMPKKYTVPVVPIGDLDEIVCKDAGINYQRVNVGMQEKGKSDLADRLLYEGKRQRKLDKMYWKGADIDRYWIADSTLQYCRPDFDDFIRPNEVIRLNDDVYSAVPKILLRQTADHIIATIDYRGVWFGRSIIAILPARKSGYKIEYFLGLLNSRYFEWFYRKLVHETHRVFAQVKLSKIKQLPIRRIDFDSPTDKKMHDALVALVDRMLKLNKHLAPIRDKYCNERDELLRDIERTDKEIDDIVYDLYGLTEEERKVVEGGT